MKIKIKIIFCFLSMLIISGCATTTNNTVAIENQEIQIIDSAPHLRMKWAETVSFNAYMDPAVVNGSKGYGTFYDGSAGAAGVLAQVFIHAALANSAQKKQLDVARKQANQILIPYSNQLTAFDHADLWSTVKSSDLGFKTYQEGDDSGVNVFETTPEFILSPDQKAIMLLNQVKVYKSDQPENVIYTNNFIVVSDPIESDDIKQYWKDESSEPFVQMGSKLFTDSLALAVQDFDAKFDSDEKHKTFRYLFGEKKMYEHGQLVKETCSTVLMKNLREYIYSIPKSSAEDCIVN